MDSEKTSLLKVKQPVMAALVVPPMGGQKSSSGASKQMHYGCLTVEITKPLDDEYIDKCAPLTLKQIAEYANNPWWLNLRRGLMISFWASIALMVLAAVLIAIVEHEHVCVAGKSLTPSPQLTNLTPSAPSSLSYLVDGSNALLALESPLDEPIVGATPSVTDWMVQI